MKSDKHESEFEQGESRRPAFPKKALWTLGVFLAGAFVGKNMKEAEIIEAEKPAHIGVEEFPLNQKVFASYHRLKAVVC